MLCVCGVAGFVCVRCRHVLVGDASRREILSPSPPPPQKADEEKARLEAEEAAKVVEETLSPYQRMLAKRAAEKVGLRLYACLGVCLYVYCLAPTPCPRPP